MMPFKVGDIVIPICVPPRVQEVAEARRAKGLPATNNIKRWSDGTLAKVTAIAKNPRVAGRYLMEVTWLNGTNWVSHTYSSNWSYPFNKD